MRLSATLAILTTAIPILLMAAAPPAEAKCHRFAFAVNDFGQEGPTKDAKELLDKYIAEWAADRGIKKYTVGKKHVACELFLNFIVFDEHTCTAAVDVCWSSQAAKERASAAPSAATEPVRSAAPPAAKSVASRAPMTAAIVPPRSESAALAEAEKAR